jgi:hypothetical protein
MGTNTDSIRRRDFLPGATPPSHIFQVFRQWPGGTHVESSAPEGSSPTLHHRCRFAATLASGQVGGQPTTVLLAGDDADSKSRLADIVATGGLIAIIRCWLC